jgi:hypothetical protein
MLRWIAGLVAVLVLPACGDGGGGRSGRGAEGPDPAAPAGGGQRPSVRIISPESGSSSPEGSTIEIQALVTDPDGTIVRVEFYDDNRLIGSDESPPYTLSFGRLKPRTYVLCAVAIDADGNPIASAPVTLFVVRESGGKDDEDGHGGRHGGHRPR